MPSADAAKPANMPGLHNVVRYSDRPLLSGSVPEGEEGFETLAALGVKTIISVDGAAPDVESAKAHGIRYVHLPITYSGIEPERELEIARAVRDLPGPLYLHCHHGKHRSASALGAATVVLGYLTPEAAVARMKVSGTASSYTGLYECVSEASVATPQVLDAASAEFPSVTKTSDLVKGMVHVDEANDHLKAIEAAGWKTPADHPDLVASAEAGILADMFRNVAADPTFTPEDAELVEWLKKAAVIAGQLEEGLTQGKLTPEELSARFKAVGQSCKDCHAKYRD